MSMKKSDLKVIEINGDLAFIFAYEVRVKYTPDSDFETIIIFFDKEKAIHSCDFRLKSGKAHSCEIVKVKIWL